MALTVHVCNRLPPASPPAFSPALIAGNRLVWHRLCHHHPLAPPIPLPPASPLLSPRPSLQVIGWFGIASAITIPDGSTFYTRCNPDPSCVNDGGWTDIYFTTYASTYLNPGGTTWSMFSAFYDGTPAPPPPQPPPSPSPPLPPLQCAPYLPPNCLPWYNSTQSCCTDTASTSATVSSICRLLIRLPSACLTHI